MVGGRLVVEVEVEVVTTSKFMANQDLYFVVFFYFLFDLSHLLLLALVGGNSFCLSLSLLLHFPLDLLDFTSNFVPLVRLLGNLLLQGGNGSSDVLHSLVHCFLSFGEIVAHHHRTNLLKHFIVRV